MQQELFRIPGLNIPVYSYGLMMVVAFLASAQLGKRLAQRHGIEPVIFLNIMVVALLSGLIGARLSHVLENFGSYTRPELGFWGNLFNAFNFRSGGLTYYGGFLLAFPCTLWYAYKKKVPLAIGMDVVAPCLMLAYGFGRIGCFLNGCCYGAVCPANAPWAVRFPYASIAYLSQADAGQLQVPPPLNLQGDDGKPIPLDPRDIPPGSDLQRLAQSQKSLPVLPSQLFSAFTAFLLCAVLLAYMPVPHAAGRVFALMCVLEGISRFILELLRTEPPVIGQWSLGMVTGVVIAAMGIALWWEFGRISNATTREILPAKVR